MPAYNDATWFPYLVLAASSPLLQSWAGSASGMSPNRLFAVSNAGSLAGLLTYPLVLESLLPLAAQAELWSVGFGLYVLLCGGCAVLARSTPVPVHQPPASRVDTSQTRAREWCVTASRHDSSRIHTG